jgi:hypothetical protein
VPYTTAQQAFIDMLRLSVKLQDPTVETDPAYQYEDDELWDILVICCSNFKSEYTPDTLPDEDKYLVLLMSKKEIWFRLASSMAPYYPIKSDDGSLEQNVRFDHYIKLVQETSKEYVTLIAGGGTGGVAQAYDVLCKNYHYSLREYNLANKPLVTLTLSGATATTINCDWTKFSVKAGLFLCYKIFYSTSAIVDEYAEEVIPANLTGYLINDIHRLKYKITGLTPGTTYHIAVLSVDRNGLYGYSEKTLATLAG